MQSIFLLWPLLLFGSAALAADAGVVTRDVDLQAEPQRGSAVSGSLRKDTGVQIRTRKGGWYQVKAGKPAAQGWLRMFNVRYLEGQAGKGSGGFQSMLDAVSSNTGGSGQATGVRGLDPAMLHGSQPNMQEWLRFQAVRGDTADARSFAGTNGLRGREVPYD